MPSATDNFASIASAGSLALSAYGSYEKGVGDQQSDEYRAAQATKQAAIAKLAASETSAQLQEKLNTTLGNINVIRAAGNVDPSSPTTGAVLDYQRMVGEREKNIRVENFNAQASQDESDAAYLQRAGQQAMQSGELGAAGNILSAVGKAAPFLLAL